MVGACTVFALALPMHSLEPFLLMLSSVFVPLFGVVVGRLGFGADAASLAARAPGAQALPIALWLGGIAAYHACSRFAPALGAALPTLALTLGLAWATRPRGASGRA